MEALRNRSEQELAGYRDAQDYLFQQDWRPLNAGLILHLHRLLFAHTAAPGGAFKTADNLVVDRGYFTGMIAGACKVFTDRAASAQTPGTKQERVREHILRHAPATFRLAGIRTAVPGISDQTIRLVLEQLRKEGRIRADGTGRSATWTRTNTAPSG